MGIYRGVEGTQCSILDFMVINYISSEAVQLYAGLKAEHLPGEDITNNQVVKM